MLRSGAVTYLTLVSQSQSAAYQGPIIFFIRNANGSELITPTVDFATTGTDTVMVQLSRDNATTPEKVLTIIASNDVSSSNKSALVNLAGEIQIPLRSITCPLASYRASHTL